MDSNAKWHPIHPQDLALATVVLTIFFSILAAVVVFFRIWARLQHHSTSLEDWLMYVGTILNMGHNAVVVYACFTGLGTPDAEIGANMAVMMEAAKMVTVWQIFYVTHSAFIKVSICATLIRLAVDIRHRYILYATCTAIVSMSVMGIIVIFVRCQPFEASWTSDGKCIDIDVIVIPTYIFSGVNIITDWTVAILPGFILWNIQLRRKLKMLCCGILGVGILASIATIVRMPYIRAYTATTDQLYKMCNIILWTVIELDLGIVAGSLPMLRKFFRSLSKDDSTAQSNSAGTNLQTFGQGSTRPRRELYGVELETMVEAGGPVDVHDKDDTSSTRRIIHVTRDLTQTVNGERREYTRV